MVHVSCSIQKWQFNHYLDDSEDGLWFYPCPLPWRVPGSACRCLHQGVSRSWRSTKRHCRKQVNNLCKSIQVKNICRSDKKRREEKMIERLRRWSQVAWSLATQAKWSATDPQNLISKYLISDGAWQIFAQLTHLQVLHWRVICHCLEELSAWHCKLAQILFWSCAFCVVAWNNILHHVCGHYFVLWLHSMVERPNVHCVAVTHYHILQGQVNFHLALWISVQGLCLFLA